MPPEFRDQMFNGPHANFDFIQHGAILSGYTGTASGSDPLVRKEPNRIKSAQIIAQP